MNLIITNEKAEFNKSQFGNDKHIVVVKFPNCISMTTNRPFKWIPTYKQLRDIKKALDEIEEISWNLKGE